MPRLHLFEIEDQPWCPRVLRDGATDYLAEVMQRGHVYDGVAPLLAEAVRASGADTIVDLCSGGGGPWRVLGAALTALDADVRIVLSDLEPNVTALERTAAAMPGARVERRSVDARQVPAALRGFRTLFTAFHHFEPEQAREILGDAARGHGIGVFEVTERSLLSLVGVLVSPLTVWLLTPLIRPVTLSRLVFTYLLPLIPLLVLFDGAVSVLRSYTVAELRAMAEQAAPDLHWTCGRIRLPHAAVTYLIGVPRG